MEDSILNKLRGFLVKYDPLTEECQVVYLLVEIRKLLDKNNFSDGRFDTLRFYCDWALHTKKSRKLEVIVSIVKGIERSILEAHMFPNGQVVPFGNAHIDFIYKKELKGNMQSFFYEFSLPGSMFSERSWIAFLNLLIQVLVDQPIELDGKIIKSLCFIPGQANLEVIFQDGKTYRFLNVF
jgi:hypothetical protein